MTELEKEKARELAERALKANGFRTEGLETGFPDSANNIFVSEEVFVKMERWPGMRRMMYQEPVILENVDLRVRTPELKASGIVDGYIYRILGKEEGENLETSGENGFYQREREEQLDKLWKMGEAMARIHGSRNFERHGLLQVIDGSIEKASSDNMYEGLLDIQEFWHGMLEDEGFGDTVEQLKAFYGNRKEALEGREESVLTHQEMDFRNLLFTGDELIVVDWESAAAADPLMDLAVLETIIFWKEERFDPELKKALRDGYRSVRPFDISEEVFPVYRAAELSRLLYVFHEDDGKVERIQEELDSILNK